MHNYQHDREWGDSYVSQVIRILMQLLPYLVEINTASIEMDTKCATDFTIRLKGGNIAVRLRRSKYRYRDLTIRALRDTGATTELAKIKAGHGFRYFYGWIDENNNIAEWILVDLDKVRESGLLENRTLIANRDPVTGKPDGTYFIAIKATELDQAGCLIIYQLNSQLASQLKKSRQVNPQASPNEGYKRAEQGYTHKGQPRDEYLRKQLDDIEKFRHLQGRGEDDD